MVKISKLLLRDAGLLTYAFHLMGREVKKDFLAGLGGPNVGAVVNVHVVVSDQLSKHFAHPGSLRVAALSQGNLPVWRRRVNQLVDISKRLSVPDEDDATGSRYYGAPCETFHRKPLA
jgi:hypothetical protein